MTEIFPADHKITWRTVLVSFVQQVAVFSQILHVLDPKKIPRTNLRILADHKWSADRSLGNTALDSKIVSKVVFTIKNIFVRLFFCYSNRKREG